MDVDANGNVTAVHTVQVTWGKNDKGQFVPTPVPGTEKILQADLVLLAMGFAGPGNQDAAAARPDIIAEIKRQHEKGSIITLCWHAVRPTDDEPVTFRGSVQGKLTDQQWADLLKPGTDLHERWCAQVDVIAGYLKELQAAHIPVLWRPYHEMNGKWFWWGAKEPDSFIKVWRHMFDYLSKTKGLDNLLWVYGPTWGANVVRPIWTPLR